MLDKCGGFVSQSFEINLLKIPLVFFNSVVVLLTGYGSAGQALEILASKLPYLLVILENPQSYVGQNSNS
jgi:hypothetical protein